MSQNQLGMICAICSWISWLLHFHEHFSTSYYFTCMMPCPRLNLQAISCHSAATTKWKGCCHCGQVLSRCKGSLGGKLNKCNQTNVFWHDWLPYASHTEWLVLLHSCRNIPSRQGGTINKSSGPSAPCLFILGLKSLKTIFFALYLFKPELLL